MGHSVNVGGTPGYSNVRVAFGADGFRQGQTAAVIVALVSENWLSVEFLGRALKVKADLRGAVSWWILVGRALRFAEKVFTRLPAICPTKTLDCDFAQIHIV